MNIKPLEWKTNSYGHIEANDLVNCYRIVASTDWDGYAYEYEAYASDSLSGCIDRELGGYFFEQDAIDACENFHQTSIQKIVNHNVVKE